MGSRKDNGRRCGSWRCLAFQWMLLALTFLEVRSFAGGDLIKGVRRTHRMDRILVACEGALGGDMRLFVPRNSCSPGTQAFLHHVAVTYFQRPRGPAVMQELCRFPHEITRAVVVGLWSGRYATPFVLGGVRETRRRAANDGLTQLGGVSIVLCFCFPLLLCFCLPMPLKVSRSIYTYSFNKSCRPWSTILSCLGLDTRNGYNISSAERLKSTSTSTFQLRKRRNEPGQASAVIDCVRFCNLPPDTHLQLPARATSPHIGRFTVRTTCPTGHSRGRG